jgi:hypothetical protein
VHPNIAWKQVGEISTQLLSWNWPGDDESILPIVTSVIPTTILLISNAAIPGLPDSSWKIKELWGRQDECNGDSGPYGCNVTPMFYKLQLLQG